MRISIRKEGKHRIDKLLSFTIIVAAIIALLVTTWIPGVLGKSYCTRCSRSKCKAYTCVMALAKICGTSASSSYGRGKVTTNEKWPGACIFCVWKKAYYEIDSQNAYPTIGFMGACGDRRSKTYGRGKAGGYVSSYVRSLCDGASASVTAFLGGYCSASAAVRAVCKH